MGPEAIESLYNQLLANLNNQMSTLQKKVQDQKNREEQERLRKIQEAIEQERRLKEAEQKRIMEEEENRKKKIEMEAHRKQEEDRRKAQVCCVDLTHLFSAC